jgi:hypothetical protein
MSVRGLLPGYRKGSEGLCGIFRLIGAEIRPSAADVNGGVLCYPLPHAGRPGYIGGNIN